MSARDKLVLLGQSGELALYNRVTGRRAYCRDCKSFTPNESDERGSQYTGVCAAIPALNGVVAVNGQCELFDAREVKQ